MMTAEKAVAFWDTEYVSSQLFSTLILAGWSVTQVRNVVDSEALPREVVMYIHQLCDVFGESRAAIGTAA